MPSGPEYSRSSSSWLLTEKLRPVVTSPVLVMSKSTVAVASSDGSCTRSRASSIDTVAGATAQVSSTSLPLTLTESEGLVRRTGSTKVLPLSSARLMAA